MFELVGRGGLNIGPVDLTIEFYKSDVGEVIIPTIEGSYLNKVEDGELIALGRSIGHPQRLLKKLAHEDFIGLGLGLVYSNLKHANIDPDYIITVIGSSRRDSTEILYITDKGMLEITNWQTPEQSICKLERSDHGYIIPDQIVNAPFIINGDQRKQMDVLYIERGNYVIYNSDKQPTTFRLTRLPEQFASTDEIAIDLDRQTGGSYALSDNLGDTLVFISVPS